MYDLKGYPTLDDYEHRVFFYLNVDLEDRDEAIHLAKIWLEYYPIVKVDGPDSTDVFCREGITLP